MKKNECAIFLNGQRYITEEEMQIAKNIGGEWKQN